MGAYKTQMKAEALAASPGPRAPAIRALPAVGEWTNVRALGAKGDNVTDDTAAIQKRHRHPPRRLFPGRLLRVTDTLKLRQDTVLIGLHPSLTQIVLPDRTPGYQGVGAPKALGAVGGQGGDNIVSGLGLNTGGINPRATALLWTAGATSMVNDVKFQGGHGTNLLRWDAVQPLQRQRHGRRRPGQALGGPVSQPVGD
jgi:hypothetical protein